ncbi:MAG: 50S ribosomal protein L15 [Nitrososphaeria archaeon]
MYNQIGQTWKNAYKENRAIIKAKAERWRQERTIVRVRRPTRLDRARSLGYKAKQDYIVVRIRLSRRGKRIKRPTSGRRPKHLGVLKIKPNVNYKETAINRIQRKYPNMKALNAYYVYKDGKNVWYEVILRRI